MEHRGQGFRLVLLAGALISIGTALPSMFAPGILQSALGLKVDPDLAGFAALARLYGGVVLAVGIGYLIAAVDPARQRGLLVVLFAVPLTDFVFAVAGVVADDLSRPKGAAFAALDLVYCLLYVRLYPRARAPVEPSARPDEV